MTSKPAIDQQPGSGIDLIINDPEFGITLGKGDLPYRSRELIVF